MAPMTMMELRRRIMMVQREHWDYVYQFENQTGGYFLDVTEGQTLVVDWDAPEGNLNGWVLNGYGYIENLGQIRNIGRKGQRTLAVTASGQVRVGAYSVHGTFSLQNGVIKIRIL